MFIVKNRLVFDDDFKVRVVAINIESFMGLGVFACKDGSCVVTAVEHRGEHEKLAKCSSLEEAEALVDDILSAMRSGASVYDCNAARVHHKDFLPDK